MLFDLSYLKGREIEEEQFEVVDDDNYIVPDDSSQTSSQKSSMTLPSRHHQRTRTSLQELSDQFSKKTSILKERKPSEISLPVSVMDTSI